MNQTHAKKDDDEKTTPDEIRRYLMEVYKTIPQEDLQEAKEIQDYFKQFAPEGELLSESLSQDRRREAEQE